MTEVTISHYRKWIPVNSNGYNWKVHSVKATGHATGSDTVCAAISCVLYGLAGYLINLRDQGEATEVENHMGGGDVLLTYFGRWKEWDERVRIVYDLVEVTLKQLEKAYPDYISVSVSDTT